MEKEMKKSFWLAILAILMITLWLLSGRFVRKDTDEISHAANASPLMSVAVQNSIAKMTKKQIVVQGRLEANRKVDLRVETAGRVEKLWVEKGQWVKKGQVLLELRQKDRQAQIAKADAEIASKQLLVKGMLRLQRQGFQAETNLKQAQADLAAAKAEKLRLQLDLADTEIKASFAGVVETRPVELGSYLEIGDTVVGLLDVSRLKAVAFVSQQHIAQLRIGQRVNIRLLDDREISATLTFIAKEADTATRSFKIEAEFVNPENAIAAGTSAELHIEIGETPAHFLSPASMVLDESGRLGVKTVNDDNRVVFNPVNRIATESNGVWVTGLPNEARIISRGQGFVLPGERVRPLEQQPTDG